MMGIENRRNLPPSRRAARPCLPPPLQRATEGIRDSYRIRQNVFICAETGTGRHSCCLTLKMNALV